MMKKHTGISPLIGRRRFLQIIAATGAAGAIWQLGLKTKISAGQVVRQSRTMMGTQINLIVYGPDRDSCEDAIQSTFTRMDELITMLSRHNSESELSALNQKGILERPGKDIRKILLLAGQISKSTGGAFDVTILPLQELYTHSKTENSLPSDNALRTALKLIDYRKIDIRQNSITLEKQGMAVTLDGIGKGYIVDQGVATLRSKGFANVYVEAGGDLMVSGTKAGKWPWQIGIRNPRPETSNELITIGLANRAVATSGDYMQPFTSDLRHHHIIDPRTGISPPELASATVTAPTVALADGLATAALVMGPEKSLDLIESMPGSECFLIGKDLKHFRTTGFHS
jgi:thiamine biosynthesis lipoprotein